MEGISVVGGSLWDLRIRVDEDGFGDLVWGFDGHGVRVVGRWLGSSAVGWWWDWLMVIGILRYGMERGWIEWMVMNEMDG